MFEVCEGVAGIDIWKPFPTRSLEYRRVHELKNKVCGPAYRQICIQCLSDADKWCYQKGCNPSLLDSYESMCNSCHTSYDMTDEWRENVAISHWRVKRSAEACTKIAAGKIGNINSQGIKNQGAILAETDILKIRAMWTTGKWYQWELAEMFGVSRVTISSIVTRRTWRHI